LRSLQRRDKRAIQIVSIYTFRDKTAPAYKNTRKAGPDLLYISLDHLCGTAQEDIAALDPLCLVLAGFYAPIGRISFFPKTARAPFLCVALAQTPVQNRHRLYFADASFR
jgi:hypothetical protein